MEIRYPDRENVQTFLDLLYIKKEELAIYSIIIDKKNYHSTIVKSLPLSLTNFVSEQLTAACLYFISKTIDFDLLISIICEEAGCQLAQ